MVKLFYVNSKTLIPPTPYFVFDLIQVNLVRSRQGFQQNIKIF